MLNPNPIPFSVYTIKWSPFTVFILVAVCCSLFVISLFCFAFNPTLPFSVFSSIFLLLVRFGCFILSFFFLSFGSFALASTILINRLHEMEIICLPFSVASHPLFKYNLAVRRFNFYRKWSERIHGIRFGCCYAWILYIYMWMKMCSCVSACGLNEESTYTNTLIFSRFCLYHWTFFLFSHYLSLTQSPHFFLFGSYFVGCRSLSTVSPNAPAGKNLWRHIQFSFAFWKSHTHTHSYINIYIYL